MHKLLLLSSRCSELQVILRRHHVDDVRPRSGHVDGRTRSKPARGAELSPQLRLLRQEQLA